MNTLKISKLLPQNNIYYEIPNDIIKLILLFYFIKLKFNTVLHSKHLIFPNERTVKRNIYFSHIDDIPICVFGDEINVNECNQFDIIIKWTKSFDSFSMLNIND